MVFTVLTLSQMAHVLAIRSERESLLTLGLFSTARCSPSLLTFGLQLAMLYVPALNRLLKTTPLTGGELAACLALSSVVFMAVEGEKWIYRHRSIHRSASGVAA